jgi:hypothetical protein
MTTPSPFAQNFAQMIEIEEAVGRLYQRFAARFSAYACEWHALAENEADHARWIRELQRAAETGAIDFDPVLFHSGLLTYILEHIATLTAKADTYSALEAAQYSAELEKMLVEKLFFEVALERDITLQATFAKLEAETRQHAERMDTLVARIAAG